MSDSDGINLGPVYDGHTVGPQYDASTGPMTLYDENGLPIGNPPKQPNVPTAKASKPIDCDEPDIVDRGRERP